jgi:hypothetical protein
MRGDGPEQRLPRQMLWAVCFFRTSLPIPQSCVPDNPPPACGAQAPPLAPRPLTSGARPRGCGGAPVAIGRALQPFPRSKPDGRVSPHPASLGREFMAILTQQTFYLTAPGPVQKPNGFHLTATRIQRLPCVVASLPWLAFTMSRALHPGIRLLRSLCPPSHMLAFSHPLTRQSGRGVPQFQDIRRLEIPVAACCAPGALGTTYWHPTIASTQHHPFWVRCISPISPVAAHGTLHAGSSRQHRNQVWSVNPCMAQSSRTFVPGLPTPISATGGRRPGRPYTVVHV